MPIPSIIQIMHHRKKNLANYACKSEKVKMSSKTISLAFKPVSLCHGFCRFKLNKHCIAFWSVLFPSILIIEISEFTAKVTIEVKKTIERMETDDALSSQQSTVNKKYKVIIKAEITETHDSCTANIISFECAQQCIASWSLLPPCTLIIEISEFTAEVTVETKKTIERMETDDGLSSQQPTVNKKYEVIMEAEITETQDSCTTNIISFECAQQCIASLRVLPPCTLITEISEFTAEVTVETKKTIERMETDDGLSSQQPTVNKKYEVIMEAEISETQDSCTTNIISFECAQQCIASLRVLPPCILITEISEFTPEETVETKKTIERMETDDGLSSQQPTVDKKYEVIMEAEVTETQDSCTTNIISFDRV